MRPVVFQTLEELEAYRVKQATESDPVERLARTVELILRVYRMTREELNSRVRDGKITITRYG
jgi:hypothetical protein